MCYKYQSHTHQARIPHDFSGIFIRPGKYQDEMGALQCKMCPPGTTTMILGVKSISGRVWAIISVDAVLSCHVPVSESSRFCFFLKVSAISRKFLPQAQVLESFREESSQISLTCHARK